MAILESDIGKTTTSSPGPTPETDRRSVGREMYSDTDALSPHAARVVSTNDQGAELADSAGGSQRRSLFRLDHSGHANASVAV